MTLLIVLGYLATTVLPAAWAMRAVAGRPLRACCHAQNPNDTDWTIMGPRYCVKYCSQGCWREEYRPLGDPSVMAVGMGIGLAWPVLLLPVLALHVAKRKPTPGALQRRIAEPEKEVDL